MRNTLAIVIPAYKPDFLLKTLTSIYSQSCKDFNLYIGDDCSPYDLSSIISQFNDGSININGRNINDINTADLRNMESYVTQDAHLFHDTLKNNLKIAKLDASDEEIVEACKKANIHEFIMSLPKGYDTMVSELGSSLSSGEKQRIALARAFLHDGELLLLDEPTSNLDSLNEAMILNALRKIKDRTLIMISHRKSTLKGCDKIIEIDSGRLS